MRSHTTTTTITTSNNNNKNNNQSLINNDHSIITSKENNDSDNEGEVLYSKSYWQQWSKWDPHFKDQYDYDSDNIDRHYYNNDIYKEDTITKKQFNHPVCEFLHNRIVELFPLGICNIWFYVTLTPTKEVIAGKSKFLNLAEGIKVDDVNDLITYSPLASSYGGTNVISLDSWKNYLYIHIQIAQDIWSNEHKCFCHCFRFRGFFEYYFLPKLRVNISDIYDILPNYNDRIIDTEPFSKEQFQLRKSYNIRIQDYFESKTYLSRSFNSINEIPIRQYLTEYLDSADIRNEFQKHNNRGYDESWSFRTYFFSYHMKKEYFAKRTNQIKPLHEAIQKKIITNFERSWQPDRNSVTGKKTQVMVNEETRLVNWKALSIDENLKNNDNYWDSIIASISEQDNYIQKNSKYEYSEYLFDKKLDKSLEIENAEETRVSMEIKRKLVESLNNNNRAIRARNNVQSLSSDDITKID